MARMTNAQRADWHWKVYQQIKNTVYCLQEKEGIETQAVREIEDYGADTITFDVWSEDEAGYVAERGAPAPAPLPKWRRDMLKADGFHVRRDGTVERNGEPVRAYLDRMEWKDL